MQLVQYGNAFIVAGTTPKSDFIARSETALTKVRIRIHFADADAGAFYVRRVLHILLLLFGHHTGCADGEYFEHLPSLSCWRTVLIGHSNFFKDEVPFFGQNRGHIHTR